MQQIQLFLQIALTMMVSAPIMAVGGVIMALREDARLSSLLIVVIPILAGIVAFMFVNAIPLFRSMQVKIDRINLQPTQTALALPPDGLGFHIATNIPLIVP